MAEQASPSTGVKVLIPLRQQDVQTILYYLGELRTRMLHLATEHTYIRDQAAAGDYDAAVREVDDAFQVVFLGFSSVWTIIEHILYHLAVRSIPVGLDAIWDEMLARWPAKYGEK